MEPRAVFQAFGLFGLNPYKSLPDGLYPSLASNEQMKIAANLKVAWSTPSRLAIKATGIRAISRSASSSNWAVVGVNDISFLWRQARFPVAVIAAACVVRFKIRSLDALRQTCCESCGGGS